MPITLNIDLWEFESPEDLSNYPATKYHTIRVTETDVEDAFNRESMGNYIRQYIEEVAADRYWASREWER